MKPLFHTWSLAVEEQFYVGFPLLLWALYRKRIGMVAPIAGLVIASLLLAQWMSAQYPSANFYLFPGRAWELAVGALLAIGERKFGGRITTRVLSHFMPIVGLAMVVVSMALFTGTTPHPSLLTVFPIIGTALLIWFTGEKDVVSRFLAFKPMVGLGLISYSLYLWHQVLFAFARLYSINELQWPTYVALIALSVLLAYLSWLLVEQPFRKRNVVPTKWIWGSAGTAFIVMVAIGGSGYVMKGFPGRRPPIEVATGFANLAGQDCFRVNCTVGDPVAPSIVLVGDSHAGALAQSLDKALKGTGKAALVLANGDIFVSSFPSFYEDSESLNQILAKEKEQIFSPAISTVILAGRFTLRIEHYTFDNGEGGVESLDASYVERSEPEKSAVAKIITDGVRELRKHGKNVVIVYPVPEVGWWVPTTLQKMSMRQMRDGLTTSYDVYKVRNKRAFESLDRIPDNGHIVRVHPDRIFCHTFVANRCAANNGSNVFYHDDDHLSVKGADLVVGRMMERVRGAWGGFPAPSDGSVIGSLR